MCERMVKRSVLLASLVKMLYKVRFRLSASTYEVLFLFPFICFLFKYMDRDASGLNIMLAKFTWRRTQS